MRILIVDDSAAVRCGVKDLISSRADWKVCGEARNGDEGIQKTRELRPDVILLDISMPGMNGLDVARVLRQELEKAKILIMSQNDAMQLMPSVLKAGGDGCIDKSHLAAELTTVIEKISGDIGRA